MRRTYLAATLAALVLATAACSDDNNSPSSNAQVRVVHGSPDAPAVDVLVDGTKVLDSVVYQDASGYLTVPSGTRNVKVNVYATATSVIDANVALAKDGAYTVIATNTVAAIEPLVLIDDLTAPAAGNIKLRLVHGAPSVDLVDIYITAPGADITGLTPNLSDVDFKQNSGYLEVAAGSYQVRITPAGTVAIDTGALTLAAGQIRTAIAVETAGGGAPFSALLLADAN
jgi:hypothetical protein